MKIIGKYIYLNNKKYWIKGVKNKKGYILFDEEKKIEIKMSKNNLEILIFIKQIKFLINKISQFIFDFNNIHYYEKRLHSFIISEKLSDEEKNKLIDLKLSIFNKLLHEKEDLLLLCNDLELIYYENRFNNKSFDVFFYLKIIFKECNAFIESINCFNELMLFNFKDVKIDIYKFIKNSRNLNAIKIIEKIILKLDLEKSIQNYEHRYLNDLKNVELDLIQYENTLICNKNLKNFLINILKTEEISDKLSEIIDFRNYLEHPEYNIKLKRSLVMFYPNEMLNKNYDIEWKNIDEIHISNLFNFKIQYWEKYLNSTQITKNINIKKILDFLAISYFGLFFIKEYSLSITQLINF